MLISPGFFEVPVNLKEQDAFHLTIEEYLLALISMVEELVSFLLSLCPFLLPLSSCVSIVSAYLTGVVASVPFGGQLRHPGRLYPSVTDRKLHQGPICRVPAAESEE